ncbi:MAG: hypothetical protein ACTJGO_14775 [Glutamicibacter arilaitensis]|uniref:hypothetical protein n=1 Tax=Glutamicibacter arilaitensis TaxID=256701 RepID=UPI003FCF9D2A
MQSSAGLQAAHAPLTNNIPTDVDPQLKFTKHKPKWDHSESDEPTNGQRYSTWPMIEKGLRGPQPYPALQD